MNKLTVKFDTRAISTDVDPSRSYTLHLLDRPVYDESQVFREVVKEKTLPFDEDRLKFAFLCVLKTMTQKVAADCIPRVDRLYHSREKTISFDPKDYIYWV